MLNRDKLTCWLPALFWALLIFFQSNNSNPAGADLAPDYVLHFFAFGVLALVILYGFAGGLRALWMGTIQWDHLAFSALLATLYGFSDEGHQYFIPGRNSSWADIAADFLGALVFMGLMIIWKNVRAIKQG